MDKNGQLDFTDLEVVKNKNMLRSHYNFSALDQKVVSLAFAKYEKNKKKCIKDGIHIQSSDLINFLKVDASNIYSQMHESAKHLVASYIDIFDDEKQSFIVLNLFKISSYKNGVMLLHFSDDAINCLETGIKIPYLLGNLQMLQSRYSTREYEIFRSYLDDNSIPFDTRKRKYFEISLNELRYMTGVTYTDNDGNTVKMYKNTGDFKIKVLDIADREINAYTDINTRFLLIKEGRAYKSVGFFISSKEEDPADVFEKEIHSVPDLKPPNSDVVEFRSDTSNQFKELEQLMKNMPEIKLLQMKHLLELTDAETILFIYKFLTKNGDRSDIYQKIINELN